MSISQLIEIVIKFTITEEQRKKRGKEKMKLQASLSTILSPLHRYIREQQPVPLDVLTWTSGADPNVEI